MKHLEVRQNYSAARRIFNSFLSVSCGDKTLRLMLDKLLTHSLHDNDNRSFSKISTTRTVFRNLLLWCPKVLFTFGRKAKTEEKSVDVALIAKNPSFFLFFGRL